MAQECPRCREFVEVQNAQPDNCPPAFYFANHGPSRKLCPASGRYVIDVIKGDLDEHCPPLD